ncbi:MAG: low molecular weight phosphatase family protein [Actinobacteria bacterium]|nr:low molecular weight phosphatase family protein [Actinomycetota bacterium]
MTNSAPAVLCVCVHNSGKSVMAQGLMQHTAGDQITATSAGTDAASGVNAQSVDVLGELGIDISGHTATQLTDDLVAAADLVVVVGTQAQVTPVGGTPIEIWDTDEPSLRGIDGIERMRLIRDDLATRVTDLTTRLTAAQ